MIGVDEARARLLESVRRLSGERVPLFGAAGRVLAEDLVAREPLPPFDYSAMDGYSVNTADARGVGPWSLRLGAESAAGEGPLPPPPLARGSAARIFTGARVPDGADAVVMQENARRAEAGYVTLDAFPEPGQHIRRRGEDLAAGALALAAGARITAGTLALAAMLERPELVVARRPRVTILCTGDELRGPGEPARAGSVAESNSASIAALAEQAAACVRVAPIVRDDPEATYRAVLDALSDSDVLVTVGGVSVGDRDFVRPSLERAGVPVDVWKVAMKPGKPLAFGRHQGGHVLGLPGNPASALVTFALFGLPLLRALQGDARPHAPRFRVALDEGRKRHPDRTEFLRASLLARDGALVACPHGNQASGAATSLAASDGLVTLGPGEDSVRAGDLVEFLRWADA